VKCLLIDSGRLGEVFKVRKHGARRHQIFKATARSLPR
jgi:hypothetical protein